MQEEERAATHPSPWERSGWKLVTFVAGWILFVMGILQGPENQAVNLPQIASILMGGALMFLSIFAWLKGQQPPRP